MLNLRRERRGIDLHKTKTMKRLSVLACMLLSTVLLQAQVREGRITYERKMKLQIRLNDAAFENMLPSERKDRFELLFAANKTLWRSAGDGQDEELNMDNGSGAQIRIVTPGNNDVLYSDLGASRKVEQREVMTRTFTVEDSIRRMNWKLGSETREILGYPCKMATTTRMVKAQRMTMDNGEMKSQEVMDTMHIVAWYTDAIPFPAGPENYQGQLPGAILELDVNNGRNHYAAVEVSAKVDAKEIREPKGKKMSQEDFVKERDKMFKEMEKNGGGNMNIRIGG
jgi:GLPGLI family protein